MSDVDEVKYVTEEAEEYVNPNQKHYGNDNLKFYERKREILCENAVQKFHRLASERYGSIENLFSTVSSKQIPMNDCCDSFRRGPRTS
jgi:hypothetical protein